ncbi:MAG: AbrB/MazE/SpoVT family DNA-binding domain-containing protein [Thiohalocapsa sp.]|nr:AbrB/MazE/SpoVT family DNA-binding domain-containing protein [Thiohalocapsa sp.]MCF7990063.1 AbrB/MazE/SpoVT family DNA-binding domain-containing protein [Thiohalocapsa sp.]
MREELNLQAGQRFAVIPKGDSIVLVPIRSPEAVRGIFKGADTSQFRYRSDRLERYQ